MKKLLKYLAVGALGALSLASCNKQEEIVFSHEVQAFPTQSGKILIEAIMPQATAQDEEIYIIGDFNGNENAIGNSTYLMEHSTEITQKWGVYLDPASFNGKFRFYSVQQGLERTPLNEDIWHETQAGAGQWINVYVDRWAKYFEPVDPSAGKIEFPDHSGTYRVYVDNQTGWSEMGLYMYGDVNNLGGGWPGIPVSGTFQAGDITLLYFDIVEADAAGNTEHLIFNDNGAGSQIPGSAEPVITFGDQKDYIFRVETDAVTELSKDDIGGGGGDPYAAFVDASPWGVIGSIASTGNSWGSDEPMLTDGTWHVCRDLVLTANDEFKFRLNADWGTNYGGTFGAFGEAFEAVKDGDNIKVPEDGTFDLFLNPDAKLIMIIHSGDSFKLPAGGGDEPEPPVEETKNPVNVLILDQTGWDSIALYMYGDKELGGGWPGLLPSGEEVIGEDTYKVFTVPDAEGRAENLIFNNNGGGTQLADYAITFPAKEVFLLVNAEGVTGIESPRAAEAVTLYVDNQTGWDAIALYMWGDKELCGGWPGLTPTGEKAEGDITYLMFEIPDAMGRAENLIFNNNGGGTQLADLAITFEKSEYYITATAEGASIAAPPANPVTVYVINETGWEQMALYIWGDAELCGGWPGLLPEGEETIFGTTYLKYVIPSAEGKVAHLIFNNNGGGAQLGDLDLTFTKEKYYVKATADGAQEIDAPAGTPTKWYVKNSTGWDNLYLYAWSADQPELFGGWPGSAGDGVVTIGGEEFLVFNINPDLYGITYNVIPNNNAGTQYDGPAITLDKDYLIEVTADALTIMESAPGVRIYVNDQIGWGDNMRLYAWGSGLPELFGGWPGAAASGTETVGTVTYKYFQTAPESYGLTYNLIFNNKVDAVPAEQQVQFDGPQVTLTKDIFIDVKPNAATFAVQ